MNINPNHKLEEYILEHTEPEDEILSHLNRETHLKMLHPRMLSGHLQGKFLEMISRMVQPLNILEIGTFTGYSAICMARGLKQGGTLDTIEINDELKQFAIDQFEKAGLNEKINLHIGNALEIISHLDKNYDLVFIDGDKKEYIQYYNLLFPLVNVGGYIIADNVLWSGKVIDPMEKNDADTIGIMQFNDLVHNDNRVMNVLLPLRDGLMISMKKED
ncbi:MAG: O-methyltransferase [bacterium]